MALHAGGARLAAEAANVPCAALGPPKAPAAGKSGVPTRGGGRRGAGGRAAASRAFPQRRQQRPPARPPAGSGRGTFPAWSRAKEPRNGAGGWRGFERSERNTRGVQLGGRGERQSGGTRRPGKSEESRGPARSQPEARAVSRRDGSGMESWGPMGKRGRTAAPGEGRKDPQVTGTTASLGGSGRFEVPSVLPSPNSPAPRPHLRPLRTPRHAGGEGVDAGIPEGSRHSRPAAEKRSRPLAPAEFPQPTSASDLGSGGRLSWKPSPPSMATATRVPGEVSGPAGRCPHLPVGISAAAERSNSRSRSRSPGGAAAATAAAAAHWDPLGSTALAMSGTCLRLAALAASGARAQS